MKTPSSGRTSGAPLELTVAKATWRVPCRCAATWRAVSCRSCLTMSRMCCVDMPACVRSSSACSASSSSSVSCIRASSGSLACRVPSPTMTAGEDLIQRIVETYYAEDLPEDPGHRLAILRDAAQAAWELLPDSDRVALASDLDDCEG